jgi:hypothetical protein
MGIQPGTQPEDWQPARIPFEENQDESRIMTQTLSQYLKHGDKTRAEAADIKEIQRTWGCKPYKPESNQADQAGIWTQLEATGLPPTESNKQGPGDQHFGKLPIWSRMNMNSYRRKLVIWGPSHNAIFIIFHTETSNFAVPVESTTRRHRPSAGH